VLRTLRGQYFLGSFAVFFAMLGLLLWNAHHLVGRAIEQHFEAERQVYGPLLASAIGPPLAAHDHAAIAEIVAMNTRERRLGFIEVFDRDGQRVAGAGEASNGGDVRVATQPVTRAGEPLGALRFGIRTDALADTRGEVLRNSLVIGAGVLAAGTLLLLVGTAWLGAGLRRLSHASRRVAEGDFGMRLPASRMQELDDVSQAFNRMAQAVQSQLTALRDNQQFLRHVLDTLSEGLVIVDRERRVLDSNEALLRVWGVSRETFTHADPTQHGARLLWPDGRRMAPDELPSEAVMATGEPQRDVVAQVRRADGSTRWVSVNATPLVRSDAAEPHAVLATLTDITRHVLAEQQLRGANEALEQRVRERTSELETAKDAAERASHAKSEFLSRMSHELRTPLNAILGFAQLLALAGGRLQEADLHKVRQIESAGWHLLGLIDDVLDLARIEAGSMSASAEPVELLALVADTLPMVQTLAAECGVTLAAPASGPDAVWVLADRKRLKQVLANLLSNAVKYNRQGGRVEITVAAGDDGRRVLAVRDTGRGFSEAQLAQVFQPFTRFAREGEAIEGTGIGLVITKRLVELMGGRLELDSRLDQGSVFRVDLPAAAAPCAAGADAARPDLPAPARAALHRLLYVEDNPSNVELLQQVLALEPGLELAVAIDGLQGLALVRTQAFDLVIVDIDLPGIDGLELCRRLRTEAQTRTLPLVALSANAMEADIRRAYDAGFDLYLTKPIDVARLLAEIRRLLDGADQRAA
jgi:PAS domain S-box-containing protein